MRQLDDATLVSEQYACEQNLQARQSLYADHDGPDAREAAFAAVAAAAPRRVLEVGGGQGELAERIVRELGAEVTFVDQSERMVELARGVGSMPRSATSSGFVSRPAPSTRRSRPGCSTTSRISTAGWESSRVCSSRGVA